MWGRGGGLTSFDAVLGSRPGGTETGRHSPIILTSRERSTRSKWSSCAWGVVHLWHMGRLAASVTSSSVAPFCEGGWRGALSCVGWAAAGGGGGA